MSTVVAIAGLSAVTLAQLPMWRERQGYILLIAAGLAAVAFLLLKVAKAHPRIATAAWRWVHSGLGLAAVVAATLHFLPCIFFFFPGLALWACDMTFTQLNRRWLKQHVIVDSEGVQQSLAQKESTPGPLFPRSAGQGMKCLGMARPPSSSPAVQVKWPTPGEATGLLRVRLSFPDDSQSTIFGGQQTMLLRPQGLGLFHPFSIVPLSANTGYVYIQEAGTWTMDAIAKLSQPRPKLDLIGPLTNLAWEEVAAMASSYSSILVLAAGSGLFGVLGVLDSLACLAPGCALKMFVLAKDSRHLTALAESRVGHSWPSQWGLVVRLTDLQTESACCPSEHFVAVERSLFRSLSGGAAGKKLASVPRVRLFPVPLAAPFVSLLSSMVFFLVVWGWRAQCCAGHTTAQVPKCTSCFVGCTPENCSVVFNALALLAVAAGAVFGAAVVGAFRVWGARRQTAPERGAGLGAPAEAAPSPLVSVLPAAEKRDERLFLLAGDLRGAIPSQGSVLVLCCAPTGLELWAEAVCKGHSSDLHPVDFRSLSFAL
jgi:hypothetical protein